jgi:hypothetical protein
MPFGLKNAGATFQRLMNKMFREQIGRNMEVYVDDILVKSVLLIDHVGDLQEAFRVLKKYWMKLNPLSVLSGYHQVSSLALWCQAEELKRTRKKSKPC